MLPERLDDFIDTLRRIATNELLWSLLVLAGVLLFTRVLSVLLVRLIGSLVRRTETQVDDVIARHLKQPLQWLLPLVVLRLTMPLHALPKGLLGFLSHAILIGIILAVGWVLVRLLRVTEELVWLRFAAVGAGDMESRAVHTQVRALRGVASFVVAVLTLGFALMTFEDVRQLGAGLLASAGLAGVVLGFAAQKSLGAILAGLQIAITQPIRVEDAITIEGEIGRIEDITLTYVVVRLPDLRRLVVPVQHFLDKPFVNWTRATGSPLGAVLLELDFTADVDALRAEFSRVLEASSYWDKELSKVRVTNASDRTMLVRLQFSSPNPSDQFELACEVREKMLSYLARKHPEALPRVRSTTAASEAEPT